MPKTSFHFEKSICLCTKSKKHNKKKRTKTKNRFLLQV